MHRLQQEMRGSYHEWSVVVVEAQEWRGIHFDSLVARLLLHKGRIHLHRSTKTHSTLNSIYDVRLAVPVDQAPIEILLSLLFMSLFGLWGST